MMHRTISFGLVLALLSVGVPVRAQSEAATIFLDPAIGVYPVGEEFTVAVRLNTGTESAASADVTVAFEPSDLEFVSFASDGSVMSRILVDDVRRPGRVDISGFVERGSATYAGTDGLLVNLTFRALRNTATQVRVAEHSIAPLVAAVGQVASNIVTGPLRSATYTLVPRESVPAVAAVAYAQTEAPTGFEITPVPVPTHEWIATTSIKLTWTLPSSATEMRTAVSDNPLDVPTKVYAVPVSSVDLKDLKPGTNYFALQFKQGDEWGPVTRFPIKVDLTPPDYVVVKEAARDVDDPRVAFVVEAADAPSGIGRYEVSLNGEPVVPWEKPEDGTYRPEGLPSGEHSLTMTAFDKAGNSTSTTLAFSVRAIEPPTLTEIPDNVLSGSQIVVRGTSEPESEITVFFAFDDGEASERIVKSDAAGAFSATIAEHARPGKYTVWFQAKDSRGATSPLSIKRSVTVRQPYIMLFGTIAVTYLSILVPLIALILLLVLTLWLGYVRLKSYRSRVRRETGEAYAVLRKEFDTLRAELVKQVGTLEKANQSRALTKEEMRIFNELSRRLGNMEAHIGEEIDDIEPVEDGYDEEHPKARTERTAVTRGLPQKHTLTIQRKE